MSEWIAQQFERLATRKALAAAQISTNACCCFGMRWSCYLLDEYVKKFDNDYLAEMLARALFQADMWYRDNAYGKNSDSFANRYERPHRISKILSELVIDGSLVFEPKGELALLAMLFAVFAGTRLNAAEFRGDSGESLIRIHTIYELDRSNAGFHWKWANSCQASLLQSLYFFLESLDALQCGNKHEVVRVLFEELDLLVGGKFNDYITIGQFTSLGFVKRIHDRTHETVWASPVFNGLRLRILGREGWQVLLLKEIEDKGLRLQTVLLELSRIGPSYNNLSSVGIPIPGSIRQEYKQKGLMVDQA